ncbi:BLUF domain-containing protein [Sphingomonas oligophenolica]|nr:BLUF domain-containing protein [Sphingomonas oligophenolica]
MDRSLLYVSRQSSHLPDGGRAIAAMVAAAGVHNERTGITGALVCTHAHFAQFLEGSNPALDDLMHRIERDHRHTDVTILRVEAITRRRLPTWSMAYSGSSTYVARQMVPLIGEMSEANPARIERLMGLLVGLASPASDPL